MVNRFFISAVVFLTAIKIAAIFLTNFSMFGDEAQYWLWSQSFEFGYFSKPPLIAWVISLYTSFFGDSFQSLKLLPISLYFVTSFAVYEFCKSLGFNKKLSMLSALSFLTMPAVSVSSFFISTDIVLLLFWTLSMIALQNIKNKPTNINFIICGIMVGLALLAKYAAIYFFVSLIVLCLFDRKFRNLFLKHIIKAFLLFFSVFIIILPNIIWNANNDWLTMQHTSTNANFGNANLSLLRGMGFLLIQVLMVGIVVFCGAILNFKKIKLDAQNIFLLSFSIPIILIVFLESVLVRANANWAAVGLISLFVFFVRCLLTNSNIYLVINFTINLVFATLFYFLIAASYNIKIFDRINGVGYFSIEVKKYVQDSNIFVVSDRLLYSSLAYELKDEKINFFMPHIPDTRTTNHFQISSPLKKDMSNNFILLGNPSELNYLDSPANFKLIKEFVVRFKSSPIKVYEVSF